MIHLKIREFLESIIFFARRLEEAKLEETLEHLLELDFQIYEAPLKIEEEILNKTPT